MIESMREELDAARCGAVARSPRGGPAGRSPSSAGDAEGDVTPGSMAEEEGGGWVGVEEHRGLLSELVATRAALHEAREAGAEARAREAAVLAGSRKGAGAAAAREEELRAALEGARAESRRRAAARDAVEGALRAELEAAREELEGGRAREAQLARVTEQVVAAGRRQMAPMPPRAALCPAPPCHPRAALCPAPPCAPRRAAPRAWRGVRAGVTRGGGARGEGFGRGDARGGVERGSGGVTRGV